MPTNLPDYLGGAPVTQNDLLSLPTQPINANNYQVDTSMLPSIDVMQAQVDSQINTMLFPSKAKQTLKNKIIARTVPNRIGNTFDALQSGSVQAIGSLGDFVGDSMALAAPEAFAEDLRHSKFEQMADTAYADELVGYDRTKANQNTELAYQQFKSGNYADSLYTAFTTPEIVAESIPLMVEMMLGGGKIKGATNLVSKAVNLFSKNLGLSTVIGQESNADIQEFTKNNNGVAPDNAKVAEIVGTNALMFSLDRMAFKDIIGMKDTLGALAKSLPTTTLIEAGKKVLATGGSLSLAVGKEAGQEYVQTWGEILNVQAGADGKSRMDVFKDKENQKQALSAGIMGAGAGGQLKTVAIAKSVVTPDFKPKATNTPSVGESGNATYTTANSEITISPMPKIDGDNIIYGTETDFDTKKQTPITEATPEVIKAHDAIIAKIQSMTSKEEITKYMATNPITKNQEGYMDVWSAVASHMASFQSARIDSETKLGSAETKIEGDRAAVHKDILEEMEDKVAKGETHYAMAIKRLMWDKTGKFFNRSKNPKLDPQLQTLIAEEEKFYLLNYLKHFGKSNPRNYKQIIRALKEVHGIDVNDKSKNILIKEDAVEVKPEPVKTEKKSDNTKLQAMYDETVEALKKTPDSIPLQNKKKALAKALGISVESEKKAEPKSEAVVDFEPKVEPKKTESKKKEPSIRDYGRTLINAIKDRFVVKPELSKGMAMQILKGDSKAYSTAYIDEGRIVYPDFKSIREDEGALSNLVRTLNKSKEDVIKIITSHEKGSYLEMTKVHEHIHIASVAWMKKNPNTKETKFVKSLFAELLLEAKNNKDLDGIQNGYWKENVYEFLAVALSNPDMITYLDSHDLGMKPVRSSKNSILTKLAETLTRMLGINKDGNVAWLVNSLTNMMDTEPQKEAKPFSEDDFVLSDEIDPDMIDISIDDKDISHISQIDLFARENKRNRTVQKFSNPTTLEAAKKLASDLINRLRNVSKTTLAVNKGHTEEHTDYSFVEQLDTNSEFFLKTALFSAVGAIQNSLPVQLSKYDDSFEGMKEALDQKYWAEVNEFNGVLFSDFVDSIARGIKREYKLKVKDSDKNQDKIDKIAYRAALYVYGMMDNAGLVTFEQIEEFRFIKLSNKDMVKPLDPFVKEVSYQDVTTPMFTSDSDAETRNEVDKTQKGSSTKISNEISEVLEMFQNEDFIVNKSMGEFIAPLIAKNDTIRTNVLELEDSSKVHPNFKEDVEAANKAKELNLNRLIEFVNDAKSESFWYKMQDNVNGRFQPYSSVADPVKDKQFARWMIDNSKGEYEVNPKEDSKQTYLWKHAITFAFDEGGLAGFDVEKNGVSGADKAGGVANLEAFDSLKDNELIQKAMDAYKRDPEEGIEIISVTGMHGIRAFLDYIRYRNGKPFKTSMPTEMDGITNGLSMQMMQVFNGRAGTKGFLEMTGVHYKNSKDKSIYSIRQNADGFRDLYETVADNVIENLKSSKAAPLLEELGAMSRKVAKNPVMIWLYNAGDTSIRKKTANTIVDNLLNTLAKPNHGVTKEMIDGLIEEVTKSELSDKEKQTVIATLRNQFNKTYKMKDYEVDKLNKFFEEHVGALIVSSMGTKFSGMSKYKEAFSNAAAVINQIAHLIEAKVGKKEFQTYPQFIVNGHDKTSGVTTYDTARYKGAKEYAMSMNINGNRAERTISPTAIEIQPAFDKDGNPKTQKRGYVVMTHNLDATVLAIALKKFKAKVGSIVGFPIFDAFSGSAAHMDIFAETYNEAFWEVNTKYSHVESMENTLRRVSSLLKGMHKDIANTEIGLAENENYIQDSMTLGKMLEMELFKFGNLNKQNKADREMYHGRLLDKDSIEQMSGIEKFDKYESRLGSADEDVDGVKVEEVMLETKNDFVNTFNKLSGMSNVFVSAEHKSYLAKLVSDMTGYLGDKQFNSKLEIYRGSKEQSGTYGELTGNIKVGIMDNQATADMSLEEIYAHELMHKITETAVKKDMKTKVELDNIYKAFVEYVSSNEVNISKKNLSHMLSSYEEFVAFSQTNEEVRNVLSKISFKKENKTYYDKIMYAMKKFIDMIVTSMRLGDSIKLQKRSTQLDAIDLLSSEIASINKKYKSLHSDNAFDAIHSQLAKINKPIVESIAKVNQLISTSKLGEKLHRSYEEKGALYSLANFKLVRAFTKELIPRSSRENAILNLTKLNTVTQHNYIESKADISRRISSLVKDASGATREHLKETLIDLDLLSISDDIEEINSYLGDNSKTNIRIKELNDLVLSMAKTPGQKKHAYFMINQAQGLGYYLAKSDSKLDGQLLNADNIVNFDLVSHDTSIEKLDVDRDVIDELASLYGIRHTSFNVKLSASKFISTHLDETRDIMDWHKRSIERAKEGLFDTGVIKESHLFIKGYSSVEFEGSNEFKVATVSDREKYVKNGWHVVDTITPTDRKFGDVQDKMVLLSRIDPNKGYESGVMSIQSPTSKGTKLDDLNIIAEEDVKFNISSKNLTSSIVDIYEMSGGQMIPLFNPSNKNEVVNFRYSMVKERRKAILKEKSDIAEVLSSTYAMTERKIHEIQDNQRVVRELVKDHSDNKDTDEFVLFSPESNQEGWALLPRETRRYIYNYTGDSSIYVRKSIKEEVMGYQNPEIPSSKYKVMLAEKIWKDIIGKVRDDVVIKTSSTFIGNIVSNLISVNWNMPTDKAFSYMYEGWVSMDLHRSHTDELRNLEVKKSAGRAYSNERYNLLQRELKNNPVTPLIEAGKFQAVVDDTDLESKDSNNLVTVYTDNMLGKLPPSVRKMIDIVYMTNDSGIYRALTKFILYSDFIARYAIYKNSIEKGNTKEEALRLGDELFIDYSVLQDKHLKYMGDLGFFMFSKYALRIQRGIYKMATLKPANMAATMGLEAIGGNVSTIDDTFGLNVIRRFGLQTDNIVGLATPSLFEL